MTGHRASLNNAPSAVWAVNDGLHYAQPVTKESAIAEFDSSWYRDVDFPIEPWIEYVKSI